MVKSVGDHIVLDIFADMHRTVKDGCLARICCDDIKSNSGNRARNPFSFYSYGLDGIGKAGNCNLKETLH